MVAANSLLGGLPSKHTAYPSGGEILLWGGHHTFGHGELISCDDGHLVDSYITRRPLLRKLIVVAAMCLLRRLC